MQFVILRTRCLRRRIFLRELSLSSRSAAPSYLPPPLHGAYAQLLKLDEYRLAETQLRAGRYTSAQRSLQRSDEIIQNSRDRNMQTVIAAARAHVALHAAALHEEIAVRRDIIARRSDDAAFRHAQSAALMIAYIRAGMSTAAVKVPAESALTDTPTLLLLKALAAIADGDSSGDAESHIADAMTLVQSDGDGTAVTAADVHFIRGTYEQFLRRDRPAATAAYQRAVDTDQRRTVGALAVSDVVSPVVSSTLNIGGAESANAGRRTV